MKMLKTLRLAFSLFYLLRDLAHVYAWRIMFDPYTFIVNIDWDRRVASASLTAG